MEVKHIISTRPHTICNKFGCNNLTTDSYCKEHIHIKQEKEFKRHKEYNQQRDPLLVKFYNSKEWRTLSKYTLMINHYLCKQCELTLADVADHIIPVEVDWDKRLDISNIQPLCHKCHNIKTAIDKKKYKIK